MSERPKVVNFFEKKAEIEKRRAEEARAQVQVPRGPVIGDHNIDFSGVTTSEAMSQEPLTVTEYARMVFELYNLCRDEIIRDYAENLDLDSRENDFDEIEMHFTRNLEMRRESLADATDATLERILKNHQEQKGVEMLTAVIAAAEILLARRR